MAQGIIRLEDMPSVILESEVPTKILVPNPGARKVVITPEESGINEEQVFTSDCLPDEIPYKLLDVVRYPDENVYPIYVANAVTSENLTLFGKIGCEKGIETINKVAKFLTWRQGMLEARSINLLDLSFFYHWDNGLYPYWIASLNIDTVENISTIGPGAVRGELEFDKGLTLFYSDGFAMGYKFGVRPVMVLPSKIKLEQIYF